jgi:hypothetical protein
MGLRSGPGYGTGWTDLNAALTPGAFVLIDPEDYQVAANNRRTLFAPDMSKKLLAEIFE